METICFILTVAGFAAMVIGGLWVLLKKVPKEARLVVILPICFTAIAYTPTQLLAAPVGYMDFTTAWDRALPLVPFFSLPYLLAYGQWAAYWLLLGWQDKDYRQQHVAGELIAKLLCALCFLLLPTGMQRPDVTGTGYFSYLTGLIYSLDKPINLLPSLHCLESWLCLRTAFTMKGLPKAYKPLSVAFSLIVFASTLLIKQHVLVDIPAGILVAELGLLIARKTKAGRLLDALALR